MPASTAGRRGAEPVSTKRASWPPGLGCARGVYAADAADLLPFASPRSRTFGETRGGKLTAESERSGPSRRVRGRNRITAGRRDCTTVFPVACSIGSNRPRRLPVVTFLDGEARRPAAVYLSGTVFLPIKRPDLAPRVSLRPQQRAGASFDRLRNSSPSRHRGIRP